MAITGISAISGEQIIAAGAVSAREAASAAFTINGNSLQGLYDTVSNNSGSWTGGSTYTGDVQGALDEVYSNSANWNNVTGKLDASAVNSAFIPPLGLVVSGIDNKPIFAKTALSANYAKYDVNGRELTRCLTAVPAGTMNESNFGYDASNNITAYNGSAFKAGDGLPQSATEAIETVTANSADWNGTTETVSSNSASWGGSALPVSAGQGVKINLIDNTLLFSQDETVLYDSSANWTGITFSEPASNFEKIKVYVNTDRPHIFEWPSNAFTNNLWPGDTYGVGLGGKPAMNVFEFSANDTGFNVNAGWHTESTTSVNWTVLNVSSTWIRPFKVIGVNRIGGN